MDNDIYCVQINKRQIDTCSRLYTNVKIDTFMDNEIYWIDKQKIDRYPQKKVK